MKKILLSFVMFFALLMVTNAQTLLNEGFNNGMPSTWTTIDNDGDGYNWDASYFTSQYAHSGNGMIASASYINEVGALTPNNWLISPQVTIPSSGVVTLTWYAAIMGYPEPLEVLISTTGNAMADFQTSVFNQTINADVSEEGDYDVFTVDLSSYAGQSIYIAFVHRNSTDNYWLLLDDVKVFAVPTTPLIDVADNEYDFEYVVMGTDDTWSTTVAGYNLTEGISVSANAPFTLSTDDVNYSSNVTIPAAGGTLYVKFAPTAATTSSETLTLTSAGAPNVTITVEGTGLDCDNVTLPYACTFDDNSVLCWDVVDANNDGYTFSISLENGYAIYNYSSNGSADDYLISPSFALTGGQFASFAYSVRSASYPETFQVLAMGADTVPLTGVMTVNNTDAQDLFVDLSALTGNYKIAIHCTSAANMWSLIIEDFVVSDFLGAIVYYADTLNYGIVELGAEKVLPFPVSYNGVTDNITYSASAPFTVSTDNVNFSSQVVVPQPLTSIEQDTIYVKYTPTAAGLSTGTLNVSYSDNSDNFTLTGEAVDCSNGIAQFPYLYDFNTGLYPPVCWSVNDPANYSAVGIDESGDKGLAFLAIDRLVTPEIHSTNPLQLQFAYVSYAGAEAVTSFAVGYSMNTVAEADFTWSQTVVADGTDFENYTTIIPANAKYVAVKAVEMNTFLYWGLFEMTNYLFIDNFSLNEISEPTMFLSTDNIDFGGVQLGENNVQTVGVTAALLTAPITVTANQAVFTVSNDGVSYATTVSIPAEGGTVYIKYEPTAEGTHTDNISFTSGTTAANVAVQGNAFDCSSAYTLPFVEGFEAELGSCWSNEDEDGDGYSWMRGEDSEYAHSGAGFYYSSSFINNIGALSPDNWLVSPVIAIPAEGASLTWYVRVMDPNYPADLYSVLVMVESQEGSLNEVFSETLTSSVANWSWRGVSLPEYAGQNIRFAFRHHDSYDVYQFMIDDIEVKAGGVGVENHEVSFGVYPNPASNMININASENMDQIQVVNMAGQCVYSAQVAGNNAQVNVSNLSDGMYFVKVYTNNGGVSTQKIVVRK